MPRPSAVFPGSARSRAAPRYAFALRATRFSTSSSSRIACFWATSTFRFGARKSASCSGFVDVEHHQARLFRRFRRQLEQVCAAESRKFRNVGFPFLARRRRNRFQQIDLRANERRSRHDFAQCESPQTVRDDEHVIVRLANHLQHQRRCADGDKDPAVPDLPSLRRAASTRPITFVRGNVSSSN